MGAVRGAHQRSLSAFGVGNLVDDPELRIPPGKRRSRRVPHRIHPARGRPAAYEGKYGESLFLTCSVWCQADEDVAVAVARGARVVVCGRLKQRMYEDREGVKRAVVELDDEEIGPASRPPAAGTRTAHRRRSSRSPRPVAAPPAPPAAASA
ncbi:single-stranded DNA-binding protein [Streptomyces sp. NPDC085929]|uniref:single-stranded DNA-binding protein n=1 Tax=Streptomyces sp. NPDC085929 TaxID=3365739 RepID=UPI0037CD196D